MNKTARFLSVAAVAAFAAFGAHADEADGSQFALKFDTNRTRAEVNAEAVVEARTHSILGSGHSQAGLGSGQGLDIGDGVEIVAAVQNVVPQAAEQGIVPLSTSDGIRRRCSQSRIEPQAVIPLQAEQVDGGQAAARGSRALDEDSVIHLYDAIGDEDIDLVGTCGPLDRQNARFNAPCHDVQDYDANNPGIGPHWHSVVGDSHCQGERRVDLHIQSQRIGDRDLPGAGIDCKRTLSVAADDFPGQGLIIVGFNSDRGSDDGADRRVLSHRWERLIVDDRRAVLGIGIGAQNSELPNAAVIGVAIALRIATTNTVDLNVVGAQCGVEGEAGRDLIIGIAKCNQLTVCVVNFQQNIDVRTQTTGSPADCLE